MSTKPNLLTNAVTADGLITGSSGVSTTTVTASGNITTSGGDVSASGNVKCTQIKPTNAETNYIAVTTGDNDMYYVAGTHYTTGVHVFNNNVRAPKLLGPSPRNNSIELNGSSGGGAEDNYYNADNHIFQNTLGGVSNIQVAYANVNDMLRTYQIVPRASSGFNNSIFMEPGSNHTHYKADAHVFQTAGGASGGSITCGNVVLAANSGSYRSIEPPANSNTSVVIGAKSLSGDGGNIELLNSGDTYYDATTHWIRAANGSSSTKIINLGEYDRENTNFFYSGVRDYRTPLTLTVNGDLSSGGSISFVFQDMIDAGYKQFTMDFTGNFGVNTDLLFNWLARQAGDPPAVSYIMNTNRYYGQAFNVDNPYAWNPVTYQAWNDALICRQPAGGSKQSIYFNLTTNYLSFDETHATGGGISGPAISFRGGGDNGGISFWGNSWFGGDHVPATYNIVGFRLHPNASWSGTTANDKWTACFTFKA